MSKFALLKFYREPLFQFLLLGAVIFAVDQYVLGNAEDPHRIVIDDARRAELVDIFQEGQGRAPSDKELDDMIVKWTQNEIMYREARLMGLDKGDEMIRQRLILKMRNILFNNLLPEKPSDEELQAWFESNRDDYDKPPLYDFEQFQVVTKDGIDKKSIAIKLAAELGSNAPPAEYGKALRRYHKRPGGNVKTVFGDEYAQKLLETRDNTWVAVSSKQGWHVARITKRYPGESTEFESVRAKVATDWQTATARYELSRAVKEIADQYKLKLQFSEQSQANAKVEQLVTAVQQTGESKKLVQKSVTQ